MGCFGSKESKKSNDIEAQLKKDRKNFESEVKLLLLGAGESGKSTFVKQMKIIHKNGFTAQDLRVYSGHVRRNVLQGMRQLCEGRARLEIEWGSTASNALAEEFFGPDSEDDDMSAEKLDACGTLWKDPALRQVWDRRSECQINDSAHYFLERLEVIRDEGYRPTTDDILHTRVRTTGIVETRFEYGGLAFLIVDVGGQRNERKKWIHCFESVTAVLFVVALSEFDQMLFEDETVRRMDESRRLFEEICNSQWFRDTPMILFLNKFDLFTEKINKGVSITGCFPDYDGAAEPQAGADYIAKQFVSLNQNANKPVYSHIISSTDTNNVKKVFDDVKAIILQTNLAKGGFYPM